MKIKYLVEFDTEEDSAIAIGEILRKKFWPPKNEFDYGCYSNFDYAPGVRELPARPVKGDEESFEWKRAEFEGIIVEWFWDGDGCLRFILPDGVKLINTDCKKDYMWEWEK